VDGSGVADNTTLAPTVSERVLRRLPGRRWVWIPLWASVPLVSFVVYLAAIRLAGHTLGTHEVLDLLTTQAVLAYACVVLLWGVGLLARQAADVRHDLALSGQTVPAGLFGRVGSIWGPLALSAVVAALITANGWLKYGPMPPLAALPLVIVYSVPILTFVWAYLTILVDLDRLGRQPLLLQGFPEARTSGLEDVGSLASTGLGLLLIASIPVLLAGADQPVTFGISIAIVALAVVIFVLSMWRIHRQMVKARDAFAQFTRQLYADAFAPIRTDPRVEVMEAQSAALRVAQSLDERAHNLLTWPIDEGTVKFTAVVITSVVTSLIVRALFAAVGF
jgi:hypothetical protein